ncbi:unnamed protein product [Amoebophrya sp. A120]|nr:unnamed protein product [Amoebophrya sp. A120]|eukprot:GSA120T00011424001.1
MATGKHVTDAYAERNPFWHTAEDVTKQHEKLNDWSCVAGKPMRGFPDLIGASLPGYRYGMTTAVRPLMIIKPCACPGGILQPPEEFKYGVRDTDGLWHVPADKKFAGFYSSDQLVDGNSSSSCGSSSRRVGSKKIKSGARILLPMKGKSHLVQAWQVRPGLTVIGQPAPPEADNFCYSDDVTRTSVAAGKEKTTQVEEQESAWFGQRWLSNLIWQLRSGSSRSTQPTSTSIAVAATQDATDTGPSSKPITACKKSNFFSASLGTEPYAADFGCVDGPSTRGDDPGKRQGQFWTTVVQETDCPCDTEFSMIVNNVKRPQVDVVLNPTTMQTVRQILKLDYPLEEIPENYLAVHQFLDTKRRLGTLQPYFQPQGHTWVFHGWGGAGDMSGDPMTMNFGYAGSTDLNDGRPLSQTRMDIASGAVNFSSGFY